MNQPQTPLQHGAINTGVSDVNSSTNTGLYHGNSQQQVQQGNYNHNDTTPQQQQQQQQQHSSSSQQYVQLNQGGQVHTMTRLQQQRQDTAVVGGGINHGGVNHMKRQEMNGSGGNSVGQQQMQHQLELDRVALTQKNHRLAKELVSIRVSCLFGLLLMRDELGRG